MMEFEKSIEILKNSFTDEVQVEFVGLTECLGRILAQDILAQDNLPKFPTSAMDGYAIKFEDQARGRLKIVDIQAAGFYNDNEIKNGECVKTFTGSLMNKSSDTLIPIENVSVENDEIIINQSVPKAFAVRPVGESYKKDELLIKKGSKIGYAEIAVLAEQGIAMVAVAKKPIVAILATGSEIVELGVSPSQAQIRSSNHLTLAALAKQAGCDVILQGIVKDDEKLIKEKIVQALKYADILITTGGVSVGDFDFVREIIKDMQEKVLINKVAIKPGRHIKISKLDHKYFFALAGFPYSAIVSFMLYTKPLIDNLLGLKSKSTIKAILKQDYKKRSKFAEFSACNLSFENAQIYVDFENKKAGSSAILNNMLENAALMYVPKNKELIKKDEMVDIYLF